MVSPFSVLPSLPKPAHSPTSWESSSTPVRDQQLASIYLLLLLFWGGLVQGLNRAKNWTCPVHFRTLIPLLLGIYTRVTNVTLLLDLAESWNLFPEGTQQSVSTSGACLGEPECQALYVGWPHRRDIWLQHGGRSLHPLHNFFKGVKILLDDNLVSL